MLQVSRQDVVADPFPHVVKQGILPDALFARLRADFPDEDSFAGQKSESGTSGSRTGSGFDIYRGDSGFDALLARSAAWREFAEFLNSEAFADSFRTVFADHLDSIGLKIDIANSHVDPSYAEPRAVMSETATLKDRIDGVANKLLAPIRAPKPIELFTRLDIHKSKGGYAKAPHCDRPNRLASLIVYFSDAEATGLKGGNLSIFKHKQAKPVESYERHPRPADVDCIATLTPKPNLGVFFPCMNNSYHGVSAVTSQGVARDFLYINISGRKSSIW